jgi:hypothetical protein
MRRQRPTSVRSTKGSRQTPGVCLQAFGDGSESAEASSRASAELARRLLGFEISLLEREGSRGLRPLYGRVRPRAAPEPDDGRCSAVPCRLSRHVCRVAGAAGDSCSVAARPAVSVAVRICLSLASPLRARHRRAAWRAGRRGSAPVNGVGRGRRAGYGTPASGYIVRYTHVYFRSHVPHTIYYVTTHKIISRRPDPKVVLYACLYGMNT